jgi:hypothetical protein
MLDSRLRGNDGKSLHIVKHAMALVRWHRLRGNDIACERSNPLLASGEHLEVPTPFG